MDNKPLESSEHSPGEIKEKVSEVETVGGQREQCTKSNDQRDLGPYRS